MNGVSVFPRLFKVRREPKTAILCSGLSSPQKFALPFSAQNRREFLFILRVQNLQNSFT